MMLNTIKKSLCAAITLAVLPVQAEVSFDAQVDYEATGYFNDGADGAQDQRFNNSLSLQAEVYKAWDDDAQSITFKPFYRHDEMDDERSHGDVRELIWHKVADEYELKVGVGKVFWGVTESAHLVDIVNQTDGLESLDGEEKLGQPMVQLLLERDWGNLDLFVLPFHREREFAGPDARLSSGFEFADAMYESDNEESNVDIAVRFDSYIDELEYAVSFFHGNSREPMLAYDPVAVELVPYYSELTQVGLEFQYLNEGWAWKFEGVHREGLPGDFAYQAAGVSAALNPDCLTCVVSNPYPGVELVITEDESYFATAAGFEYTQVGIFETRIDLGWVVEHLYDSRQEDASLAAFEHDVLLATRWAANDEADSTLLAGVMYDYEYEEYSLSFEGNTRLMDGLSVEVEARVFAPSEDGKQYGFRDEDFVKLTFSYYL
jgi:hypothetical protein